MLAQGITRPGRLLVVILLVYAFMWIKGWPRYYDDDELPPSMRPQTGSALGPHRVGHDHLVVSFLTTATDVYTKLAPSLSYLFPEDKDPTLIFSDLQMNVGEWPVFDVVFAFPKDFIAGNKELLRYRQQLDYARKSIPLSHVKLQDPTEEAASLAMLKTYKILQAMSRAWDYRPDRSWYAFVDDDTFVDRVNTLDWLAQYNPTSKWFFGNPSVPGVPDGFAAGGSSFIVSAGVMEALFKERKDIIKNWLPHLITYPSAFDLIFAVLQTELKLDLTGAWPGISGADPSSVPFSPAVWCERVMMMHHVSPDIGSDLYLFRVNRTTHHIERPLLFADLWERFMAPENLQHNRSDWDNLSSDSSNTRWNILFQSDDPNDGHAPNGEASAQACADACEKSEYCMQWSYSSMKEKNWNENGETKCHLSSSLRFGVYKPRIEESGGTREWMSGWRKDRFEAWSRLQRCKNPTH